MDLFWYVATLWILVGLAATLLAVWLGTSLRDEFLKPRGAAPKRRESFRVIRARKPKAA